MTLLGWIAIYLLVFVIVCVVACVTAPKGYQNNEGFFYGKEGDKK